MTGTVLLWDAVQWLIGTNEKKRLLLSDVVKRKGRLLEIGCATGSLVPAFEGVEYVGVEPDRKRVEVARKRYGGPGRLFLCCDALDSDLGGDSFDWVVLSHTAHHLSDDYLELLIVESCRLLRIGGSLVILDMERPTYNASWGARIYAIIDRGRFLRTHEELENIVRKCPRFQVEKAELHPCRKWGVPIIDQCVVIAQKVNPVPSGQNK